MSSIHRQPGRPYYFCAFTDPRGFRKFRSTGTSHKAAANVICEAWAHAAKLARDSKLSNAKAMVLVREAVRRVGEKVGPLAAEQAEQAIRPTLDQFVQMAGGSLEVYTVRTWMENWLGKRSDATVATRLEYRRSVELLTKFLGTKMDLPLSSVSDAVMEQYKDNLSKRLSPSSVNKQLKIMRSAFKAAVAARQLEFNPVQHISGLSRGAEPERVPFTTEEVRKLISNSKGDLQTWILIAAYTGLRSGDAANICWGDVDLTNHRISIGTQKTGRQVIIPIAKPLLEHFLNLPGRNEAKGKLTPSLAGKRSGWLANSFRDVMVSAGLAEKRSHKSRKIGRDVKRATSKKSFHSLRYFYVTILKAAGVSESIAMDLAGHDNPQISQHYTRIDEATKAAAIAKLPDLTKD